MDASEDAVVTNTLQDKTQECIALGSSGNVQGSIKCLDLSTGHVPDRVIKKVIMMGKRAKQTPAGDKLNFLNKTKAKFDWDNDDLYVTKDLIDPSDDIIVALPGISL